MREIKFRAWDKRYNKLWSWEYITEHMNFGVFDSKDWELMQFTGLKDKNNKEIYEGDILTAFELPNKKYFLVEWDNFCSKFSFPYSVKCVDGQRQYEVIGNIYENPELLTSLTQ